MRSWKNVFISLSARAHVRALCDIYIPVVGLRTVVGLVCSVESSPWEWQKEQREIQASSLLLPWLSLSLLIYPISDSTFANAVYKTVLETLVSFTRPIYQ
jgi:hypothetical protein